MMNYYPATESLNKLLRNLTQIAPDMCVYTFVCVYVCMCMRMDMCVKYGKKLNHFSKAVMILIRISTCSRLTFVCIYTEDSII